MDVQHCLMNHLGLRQLAAHQLTALSSAFVPASYACGEVILARARKPKRAFLILEGEVSVGDGTERRRLGPGDTFGFQSMASAVRSSSSYRALTPVRVAYLPRSACSVLLNARSPMALAFRRVVLASEHSSTSLVAKATAEMLSLLTELHGTLPGIGAQLSTSPSSRRFCLGSMGMSHSTTTI